MRTRASLLVGRDDELRTVEQALRAARSGTAGAVFLVGEGGIGKSRLAAAAADLGFADDMSILRGRGSSVGPMVPFRSLAEALMSLLRAGETIDIEALGPYRPVLARLIPDWGPPPPGEASASLVVLAEAVLRLAALVGRGRGCLMIFDDLQDADAETLAVIEYLVDNLDRQPTMLLGTVRTEPCPALDLVRSAAQRRSAVLIELNRLADDEVRRLAGACLGGDAADVPEQVAEHLRAHTGGIPLLVEELLSGMLSSGLLVAEADGWRVTGKVQTTVSTTLARSVAGRLAKLGAPGRELLSVAAVLGRRFPLAVVQTATGLGDRELLSYLHAELTTQLVAPDEEISGWYAFQHPLIAEALQTLLHPGERSRLTRQVADAVEQCYPGLPGEWCQIAASLRLTSGDRSSAGRLFAEAGRRALAQGAAKSAVTLLDKATGLLTQDDDAQDCADAFATLLYALAEAGQVERAVAAAGELDRISGVLDRRARAQLHTRLAWAAAVAGRSADGLAQVETARRLLGPDAADRDVAPVDAVAAHLMLDVAGPGQVRTAESLARRAAAVAEAVPLPVVACQAWQLLGALSRGRDPDEATACLERARELAVRHGLRLEEIHALIRLGNDDALRDGNVDRLEQVRLEASQVGAVTTRYQAEASLALYATLRGDFADAEALLDQVLAVTTRLKLLETTRYALLLRAIVAAHRGRRREMDAALAELRRWAGDLAQLTPRVHGLARAWCALLEENRPRAIEELSLALAAEERSPSIYQLTGRYGLHLLLRVLNGEADHAEYTAVTSAPVSRLRWDRQFALFAKAVLEGRAGRAAQAAEAVAEAERVGAPYATGRHMGLRLVSEAAVAENWGTPVEWLRTAEEHFHTVEVTAVASACRALMRRAGAPVAQRRRGVQEIPSALRTIGVTVREFEILRLLIERLGNREIAERLHLSPRTVEKHVASLIAKTGQRDRIALSEFGSMALSA
ncbi:AAA family ATPase [Micromonospora sp. NPDC093277]|uniref:AAA family ATPase n=1 Tax=Micromonospora sp. NPDC093277 TaxID=3364291 RepID=UPI00380030DE